MSRFDVGDVVTVRDDLVEGEHCGGILFKSIMDDFRGKNVTISGISDKGLYFVEETAGWLWSEDMFLKKPVRKAVARVKICVDKELVMPISLANKLKDILFDNKVDEAKTFIVIKKRGKKK